MLVSPDRGQRQSQLPQFPQPQNPHPYPPNGPPYTYPGYTSQQPYAGQSMTWRPEDDDDLQGTKKHERISGPRMTDCCGWYVDYYLNARGPYIHFSITHPTFKWRLHIFSSPRNLNLFPLQVWRWLTTSLIDITAWQVVAQHAVVSQCSVAVNGNRLCTAQVRVLSLTVSIVPNRWYYGTECREGQHCAEADSV